MNNTAEYKTIQYENLNSFDEKCNELSKDGWFPPFGMIVAMIPYGGENLTKYIQQWCKLL